MLITLGNSYNVLQNTNQTNILKYNIINMICILEVIEIFETIIEYMI